MYLEGLGGSSEVLGRSLNFHRGVSWSPWEVPGGPWESSGRHPKQMGFSWGVSGGSWGALGVVLVLSGRPWVGPGKSEYFETGFVLTSKEKGMYFSTDFQRSNC